jgi:pimeloyl-ACP methyl ester carboxylesterase
MIEQLETVEVEGGTIDLLCTSEGECRLRLLCVHGWTLDHRSFARQKSLATTQSQVTTFDRRGHGASRLQHDVNQELLDLKTIIDACPVPTVLFGVSQGARICLRYTQYWPETVAGLIFQGGVVDDYPFDPNLADEPPLPHYTKLVAHGHIEQMRSEWLGHPLMARGVSHNDANQLKTLIEHYDGNDLTAKPGPKVSLPEKTPLREGLVPSLICLAEDDSQQRKIHAERLAMALKGSLAVSDGGHLWNWTHSEDFNAATAKWLKNLTLRHG